MQDPDFEATKDKKLDKLSPTKLNLTSSRVRLNVGGTIHETFVSTLLQFPDTLLGTMFDPRNDHMLKRDANGEVFIDRNGAIFSLILDFYRTAGLLSPFTSSNFSQPAIQAEVDFFQLPSSPTSSLQEVDETSKLGEVIAKKAAEAARGTVDQNLYTLLLRQIQKALFHAAGTGLQTMTIKFSHLGQTFFGQDLVGNPIYMITNAGARDIFTVDHRKALLLSDLKYRGLKVKETPLEPGMIVDTIWRLTFELYQVPT